MTQDEVTNKLKAAAKPNQSAWALSHGLSASYVSDVINGRRDPSKAILDALGLERVPMTYRAKSKTNA